MHFLTLISFLLAFYSLQFFIILKPNKSFVLLLLLSLFLYTPNTLNLRLLFLLFLDSKRFAIFFRFSFMKLLHSNGSRFDSIANLFVIDSLFSGFALNFFLLLFRKSFTAGIHFHGCCLLNL